MKGNKRCYNCRHWLSQYKTLDDVAKGKCSEQTVDGGNPVYKSETHWCSKYAATGGKT